MSSGPLSSIFIAGFRIVPGAGIMHVMAAACRLANRAVAVRSARFAALFLGVVAAVLLSVPADLVAGSDRSRAQKSGKSADMKLLRVAPGKSIETSLDRRAHGDVAVVRIVPADRRSTAPGSLKAEVVIDRSGVPRLRVSASPKATPGGPYLLEGRTRDRTRIELPFRIQVVAGKAAPEKTNRTQAEKRETVRRSGDIRAAAPAPGKTVPVIQPEAGRTHPVGRDGSGVVTRRTGSSNPVRPQGRALLILLENGGLRSSLEAIGSEMPELPGVPFLAYPKGADEAQQVRFLMNKNESIAEAVTRLSGEIETLSGSSDSNLFAQAHQAGCSLLPQTANRVVSGTCHPRQECFELTPGNPACNAFPTSVPCPESETFHPRQECLDNPPDGPTLQAGMLDPGNWEVQTQPFAEWLDITSDYLIEEIAKVARHQAAFLGRYDQVVVLEDNQVKPQIAIDRIKALSQDHVVDIHVLTHGTTNKIIGVEQDGTTYQFTENTFFEPLRTARLAGEPVWIRAVYQMNCNSGTLIDEWQSLGATVIAGTKLGDVSNYLPQQYIPFVNHWLAGQTFDAATAQAYQQARFVSEDFYAVLSDEENLMAHSELAVTGTAMTRVEE